MAVLASENRVINGKKTKIYKVYFYRNGTRDRIFLGRTLNKANAVKFRNIVHELEQAMALGQEPDADLQKVLNSLSPVLLNKLIERGLAKTRTRKTMDQAFDAYLQQYSNPNTLKEWKSLQRNCADFFGATRLLGTISQEDCRRLVFEYFKQQEYGPPTIEKRLKNLKQIMRFAVDQEWISVSPAQKVRYKISKEQKVAEKPYVPPALISLACDAMPNEEWACYLAWVRWLGARQREPLEDHWEHVDFANKRVHRYDNKKRRRIAVPLAKELHPYLVALQASLEFAGKPLKGPIFPGVKAHANPWIFVRRQLLQAGIQPWKSLFNSLRASRSRELIRNHSPAVEAALIGHSADIAMMHYDDVLESDWRSITGDDVAPGMPAAPTALTA